MPKQTSTLAIVLCTIGILGILRCGGRGRSETETLGVPASAPAITTQPANLTVTAPHPATFTVTAAGTALIYQWSVNGTALPGATASSYTTPATTAALDGARSSVTVSGIGTPVSSQPATLTVDYPPTISAAPSGQTVLEHAQAKFSVAASGEPALHYQWQENGVDIARATAASYTLQDAGLADNGGTFTVTVSNGIGSPVTSAGAVLVVDEAPAITTQPTDQALQVGTTLTLTVAASGSPTPTYHWFHNGADIAGATSATYTVQNAQAADGGSYYATAGNGFGTDAQSRTATINVVPPLKISGQVTMLHGGAALSGVQVVIDTTPPATTTTDASGDYAFTGLAPGPYTITPSVTGASSVFYPSAQIVTATTSDLQAPFKTVLGHSVSGTVFTSAQPATIYLQLHPATGGLPLGTSIQANGGTSHPFTIRGVPPGTYHLSGYMDLGGQGLPNANNPAGFLPASIVVTGSDVSGPSLFLADPVIVLTGQPGPGFIPGPMDGGVVINYNPIFDPATFEEGAQTYTVEWSSLPTFATVAGSRTFPANASDFKIISDPTLVNGQATYFRMRGQAGATVSNDSTAPSAVTIGPGTGGNTVSGTITFPDTASGPLYAGFVDLDSIQFYLETIPHPVSPQAFTVAGVPDGHRYQLFALLDQNGDGLIGAGDGFDTAQGGNGLTIDPLHLSYDLSMVSANAFTWVSTRHLQTNGANDQYRVNLHVGEGSKNITALTIASGPNVMAPADLPNLGGGHYSFLTEPVPYRPAVGDTYRVQVTYSDGTSETLEPQVTAVLDAFAQQLGPAGAGLGIVEPSFSWSAPATPPPGGYVYRFSLMDPAGNTLWYVPGQGNGLLSTVGTLAWGVDPTTSAPPPADLVVGTPYTWSITVVDAADNQTEATVTYQP